MIILCNWGLPLYFERTRKIAFRYKARIEINNIRRSTVEGKRHFSIYRSERGGGKGAAPPPTGWPPEAAENMTILWCKTAKKN